MSHRYTSNGRPVPISSTRYERSDQLWISNGSGKPPTIDISLFRDGRYVNLLVFHILQQIRLIPRIELLCLFLLCHDFFPEYPQDQKLELVH